MSAAGVATPELDKMLAAVAPRKVNDTLTDFVDWLTSDGIVLARYGATKTERRRCGSCGGRGFDAGGLTARQRQLLRRGELSDGERPPCPDCDEGFVFVERVDEDSLEPVHEPWGRLFARFLQIDEDACERERRATLEALRSG